MFISSSSFMPCVGISQNLRVFGPGLNPFAPYCVAHHSITSR
ncbi:hypothetical protein SLEP1_g9247 [Rubroshorea leprosula]|uniref:Uncharacterized protein n=1 Tax=Rubroshorea leprosula TaxID=152421 RepID=A0AAV5IDI0_9ROSI|nr:hypothetical protein SLEP1_g9247 [Rubroshorea leprosula]